MTETAAPGFAARSIAPDTAAICPYLLASDAAWRSSSASREHRCHAVAPAALLATDKQRRLCLAATHTGCSTFLAATSGIDETMPPRFEPDHRPVTRTAPLVLDRRRIAMSMPGMPARGAGQGALVALMVVAFGALAVTRMGAGGPGIAPAAADSTGSPRATATASIAAVEPTAPPSTPDAPERTLVPTEVEPTPSPSPSATASPSPAPSRAPTTYTVQKGDTLSGIAGDHGTTWQVLAELNEIADPRRLRVGQVIELP